MIVAKRTKSCKACGNVFLATTSMRTACSAKCLWALNEKSILKAQASKERKETKAKLLSLKGLSYWEGRAQHAVNKYVRLRDEGQGCISCDITYSTVWNAGHYIAVGANSSHSLRYNEDNIHLQCVQCNKDKGGNAVEYLPRLVAKIGQERVDALRAWHPTVKSTIEQCRAIEAEYIAKTRLLLAKRELNAEAA